MLRLQPFPQGLRLDRLMVAASFSMPMQSGSSPWAVGDFFLRHIQSVAQVDTFAGQAHLEQCCCRDNFLGIACRDFQAVLRNGSIFGKGFWLACHKSY